MQTDSLQGEICQKHDGGCMQTAVIMHKYVEIEG